MKKKPLRATLSGAAGEYFVAAELSKRGYVASITPKNTQAIDILAARQDGSRIVGIQVKTTYGSGREWVLSKKDETAAKDDMFYVFVSLNGVDKTPDFHIVPSAIVSQQCAEGHIKWLAECKCDGNKRKDTEMRKFKDPEGKYHSQWSNLRLDE